MKKWFILVAAMIILAGCHGRENQQPQQQAPNAEQRQDISRKLILKAFSDLQNKDLKGCLTDLETSIKINPSDPQAYLVLGQILIRVQEYGHAAEFLDMTAKNFPDNGTVFYMLGLANKMAGKKLPAVLAARHSVELFQAQQDRDNMLKSVALLHELVDMPDNPAQSAAVPAASSQAETNTADNPAAGNAEANQLPGVGD